MSHTIDDRRGIGVPAGRQIVDTPTERIVTSYRCYRHTKSDTTANLDRRDAFPAPGGVSSRQNRQTDHSADPAPSGPPALCRWRESLLPGLASVFAHALTLRDLADLALLPLGLKLPPVLLLTLLLCLGALHVVKGGKTDAD